MNGNFNPEHVFLTRAKYFLPGILLGCVWPVIAFSLETAAGINPVIAGKKNILYLISIAVNMIIMRIWYRRFHDDTVKGMALSMFISAVLIFNFRFPR